MNKQRLLKLADGLEDVDSKRFNLDTLVSGRLDVNACKSTGCALGYCPKIFNRSKWRYFVWDSSSSPDLYYGDSRAVFGAAKSFFGINMPAIRYLFDPYYYPVGHRGRKAVIARIRSFVLNNGKFKLICH